MKYIYIYIYSSAGRHFLANRTIEQTWLHLTGKNAKKHWENKKQKRQNSWHNGPMATHWPHIVCGCFGVCWLFVFDHKLQKPPEHFKKHNSRRYGPIATPWPHIVCGVFFGGLFLFSNFWGFWPIVAKTKKQSSRHCGPMAIPLGPTLSVFFLFSRCFFLVFGQKWPKPRENKKPQNSRHYGPMAFLGPT